MKHTATPLIVLSMLMFLISGCVTPASRGVTPKEINQLDEIGLKFGQEYNSAKAHLLSIGWTIHEDWSYFDDPDGRPEPGTRGYYPMGYGVELACGRVSFSAKFSRGEKTIILIVFDRGKRLVVSNYQ